MKMNYLRSREGVALLCLLFSLLFLAYFLQAEPRAAIQKIGWMIASFYFVMQVSILVFGIVLGYIYGKRKGAKSGAGGQAAVVWSLDKPSLLTLIWCVAATVCCLVFEGLFFWRISIIRSGEDYFIELIIYSVSWVAILLLLFTLSIFIGCLKEKTQRLYIL